MLTTPYSLEENIIELPLLIVLLQDPMQRLVIPERLYGQITLLKLIGMNERLMTLLNTFIMQRSMVIVMMVKKEESLLSLLLLGRLSSGL